MKKLLLLIGLFALSTTGYSQCDKKVTFKCYKGRDFKNGVVDQELSLEATISISNGKIIITASMNGEAETVEGEIKEVLFCEWAEYLKDGKTRYKVYMKKGNEGENSFIDIESEGGKTKITGISDPDTGSKLQFDVADYTIDEGASSSPGDNKLPKKKKTGK